MLQDIDLEGTGFSQDDLTSLLDSVAEPGPLVGDPDDVPEEPDEVDVDVDSGDPYLLGSHRIPVRRCDES